MNYLYYVHILKTTKTLLVLSHHSMSNGHYTDVKDLLLCFVSMTFIYLYCFCYKLNEKKKKEIQLSSISGPGYYFTKALTQVVKLRNHFLS